MLAVQRWCSLPLASFLHSVNLRIFSSLVLKVTHLTNYLHIPHLQLFVFNVLKPHLSFIFSIYYTRVLYILYIHNTCCLHYTHITLVLCILNKPHLLFVFCINHTWSLYLTKTTPALSISQKPHLFLVFYINHTCSLYSTYATPALHIIIFTYTKFLYIDFCQFCLIQIVVELYSKNSSFNLTIYL